MESFGRILRALARGLDVAASELERENQAVAVAAPPAKATPPRLEPWAMPNTPAPKPTPEPAPEPETEPEPEPATPPTPAPDARAAADPPKPSEPAATQEPKKAKLGTAPERGRFRMEAEREGRAAARAGRSRESCPHQGVRGIAGARRCGWLDGFDAETGHAGDRRAVPAPPTLGGAPAVSPTAREYRDRALATALERGKHDRLGNSARWTNPYTVDAALRDQWWEGWDAEDRRLLGAAASKP